MSGICNGRVVVITGPARGIGRAHALAFAAEGAKVVVKDLGAEVDGRGSSDGPAGDVVDDICGMGGEAVANGDDVSDWDGAGRLIQTAIETFGDIDVPAEQPEAPVALADATINITVTGGPDGDVDVDVHLAGGTFERGHTEDAPTKLTVPRRGRQEAVHRR
jgi:NAD(P)-dependent dehydrogenase (short-subunit alcohol dehydrogenase family)